ncbi:hypothetical protein MTR_3g047930 [Medicago truncatula]|uniref:Uncharacterized protein n=1 Tax=Medicago truncatula TaxID=3880 RepID=G7IXW9_MEDTR|nr:hypothetical protein MTR_3g047930 [Medicago truncatula]
MLGIDVAEEDVRLRYSSVFLIATPGRCLYFILTEDQLKIYALADIELLPLSAGKSLAEIPPMPREDPSLIPDLENRLIHDEMNYNRGVLDEEHSCLMSTMTDEPVHCDKFVFSHGQLYVPVSRITSREGLKILINNEHGEDIDATSNVVYKEVFRNV